jgi:inactivated superfamily I helicase
MDDPMEYVRQTQVMLERVERERDKAITDAAAGLSDSEDIELARRLAHEIQNQAHGTKDAERLFIIEMAQRTTRLLSGAATDEDRAAARALLDQIPSA